LDTQRGDTYVVSLLFCAASQERLESLMAAVQVVIDRHDILRTAVLWEQLPQPVQVVYRRAMLPVEAIILEGDGDPIEQLRERMRPQRQRLDLRQAPLLRLQVVADPHSEQRYALLQLHHITADHETLEAIEAEVVAHFEGQESPVQEVAPYRNHVAQALAYARTQDAEEFFRGKLGDVEEPTAPFGLLDVHGDASQIEESHQELVPQIAQRVRAQARRLGVSAATLFHAAWALVLARTSARDDVVFGTVLLGRLQGSAGAQRIMGMFINTLPLRLPLEQMTAQGLVERTQRELVELLGHEQSSLAVAQRCSGVSGSTPLFSTLLNYRHSAPAKLNPESRGSDASGIQVLAEQERSNYPITVSVDDLGDGFALTALTDRRIDPQRITGYLHTAVLSLVEALEEAPQTPALSLPILPEAERRQVLEEFNAPAVPYPQDRLIHELFESQVERTPGAVAVRYEDQSLTYTELNRKANQLAHYLRARQIGPDQLVGICVERSLEMVVGLLGILKAGGAYVPLDPGYPSERLQYMLSDAAPRVLLTQGRLRERLPLNEAEVIALDEQWGEIAQQPVNNLDSGTLGLGAYHLAYVIYTSGSTGQPKGVMVEHAGLLNYLHWALRTYAPEEGEGSPVSSPLAFDATVTSLYSPLLSGRAVMLIRSGQELESLEYLLQQPRHWSLVKISPAHLQVLGQRLQAVKAPCSVGAFVIGGEALAPATVELWRSLWPQTRLINEYGPTETVVGCCVYEVPRDWMTARAVPIGRPIANTQMYILDRDLRPVPLGVMGEIYIGGAGVARGYLNRPELTAERFIKDPFSSDPQGRMYKTGDLGRWRADGNIEYLGRNDHQVKIRGFRIELGEIETQLLRHEQIQEAVVIAREDVSGEKRLVAYVVAGEAAGTSEAVSVERLREYLKSVLPDYMVPSAFVLLESLPLTANGKLDRKALPAPAGESFGQRGYEAPQGELESTLAQLWQELLRLERVGRHDNFFELGGHSLLAVESVHRLRHLGINVHLEQLFKSPTVASLTEWILSGSNDRLLNKSPVVLRDGAPRRPLFLVHEVTGHVFPFFLLAREIEADVPIYGLPLIEQPIPECIEQLASVHVTAIRNVQPRGPYRLAGHSFGGVLAYEIAAQLIDADETVEFLGLIDSYRPMPHADDVSTQSIDLELSVLRLYVEYLFPKMDDSQRQTLLAMDSPTHLLDYCKESGLLPRALNLMHVEEWARTYNILHTAVKKYVAVPLSVPTYLFVPDDDRNDRGWRAVLDGNLRIEKVGGTHISMIQQPHVRTLGQAMSRDLEVAESSRREESQIQDSICRNTFRSGDADHRRKLT
jgi:amino acid adenylation domain-containing protein